MHGRRRRRAGAGPSRRRGRCSASWRPRSTATRRSGCGSSASPARRARPPPPIWWRPGCGRRAGSPGLIGTVGIRIDGRDEPSALTTPEAPDLQALLAVMVEQRRRHRGDGGVQPRAEPRPRRRRATSRSAASPTCPATTSTSIRRWRTTSTPRRGCSTPDRQRTQTFPWSASTTTRAAPWPRGAMRPGHGQRDRTRRGLAGRGRPHASSGGAQEFVAVDPGGRAPRAAHRPAGALQRRQLPAGGGAAGRGRGVARAGRAGTARRATVPGRLEPIDRGQDFLALVDYAHKPGALRAVLETLRAQTQRPARGGVRRRRQPRPRQARADGRVAAELADLVVVTDDNPRDEDPADDPRGDPRRRGGPAAPRRSSRSATAGRPSTTRSAGPGRATSC